MVSGVQEMTATQRLADHMLGGNLKEYVLSRRARGVSWRLIALDLRDDIGLDVTYETVRTWYLGDDVDQAAPVGGAA